MASSVCIVADVREPDEFMNVRNFPMRGFSIRLTHKIMAIGIVGLIGLLVFGAIYQFGSW